MCMVVILHTSQSGTVGQVTVTEAVSHCHTAPLCPQAATVSSNTRQVTRRSRPIQEMRPPIRWEKVETVALIVTANHHHCLFGLLPPEKDSNPASPNWTASHLEASWQQTTQLCRRPINLFPIFTTELFHTSVKKLFKAMRTFAIVDTMMKSVAG